MQLPSSLFDLVMHLDVYLASFTATYGTLTYAALAAVIFCETGLVVTPFLPGDSLLFAAGAVTSAPGSALNPLSLFLLLWAAGICGDSSNYWIGRFVGPRAFHGTSRLLNRKHLDRTHAFYEKHGAKTVIIARFVPIVRTFAPFVAGLGAMRYRRFLAFSILGNLLWVGLFVWAGHFFANVEIVQKHFSMVIMAVILISLVPGIVEYLRHRHETKAAPPIEPR
ncbi:MAG TPA: DedA family protein [Armatimonadota bacterium]|jgi:membrane-associated protein